MSNSFAIKLFVALAMVLAIVFGLRSCTSNLTGDLTEIAKVNSPGAAADANTQWLLGIVRAEAEATRQAVLASGQAQLEIERARALQNQTLREQAVSQEAKYAADLAAIEAQKATTLAAIQVETSGQLALLETQKINTLAEWAVKIALVIALVIALIVCVVVLWLAARRVDIENARAREAPLQLPYNRETLLLPAFVTSVDGVPTLVDPNVGGVLRLSEPVAGSVQRAQYIAAQNAVIAQARNDVGGPRRMTLPPGEGGQL